MDYKEENNYPKAFITTGIICIVMAALCYFIVFQNPPVQIDGTGGILVNYGTTDQGMGKDQTSTDQPSVAEKANKTAADKVTEAPPTEQKTQVDNSDQKVVTQDAEDAPVVAANSKKPSKSVATQPVKPEKKQVVNQNALYKGASNNGAGAGDGPTGAPGNHGSPNGSTLSDNDGKGGSGGGLHGMPQWSFVNALNVTNNNRVPGIVVVNIVVDQSGNVIFAEFDRKKTRMADLELIQKCVATVKNSKLTSSTPANDQQKGQVVFQFNVD